MASASPPSPPLQTTPTPIAGSGRPKTSSVKPSRSSWKRQRRAVATRGPHHHHHHHQYHQRCPPCDHAAEEPSCVANAIGKLCQSFLLSYGVRVGMGILLRTFKLARRQSYTSLLDLKQLVSAKDLIVREEACRIGLFFGGFTGSYHALRCLLRKLRKKETPLNAESYVRIDRKVASKDHGLVYWIAGSVAALSVLLLEKKVRCSELALYVLPRAGDSLWYILVNRHLLPNFRNAGVFLLRICMGGIMYYLENEPETMAPFLRGLIRRFLASRISSPGLSSNRNASYTYLETLDAMKKPNLQESQPDEDLPSQNYNLEFIPGLQEVTHRRN